MALPDSYVQKYNAIPAYFDAMQDAQAPERFTMKFMEGLGFSSSNDRLFIKVLKDLGFISTDGMPTERYYKYLDKDESSKVLAEAIQEAYYDLFAVNKNAQTLGIEELKNKLKTLFQGKKSEVVIDRIAKTFKCLCDIANFDSRPKPSDNSIVEKNDNGSSELGETPSERSSEVSSGHKRHAGDLQLRSLQYHINIILPESRDQSVYDAIFKSLRDHL